MNTQTHTHKSSTGLALAGMSYGDWKTVTIDRRVYAHVWFDSVTAHTDMGDKTPAGEWLVIISTSPDRLCLDGSILARKSYRAQDSVSRSLQAAAAEDFIRKSLLAYRNKL